MWSFTSTGSKLRGSVAWSLMESSKEYLLRYPPSSSSDPKRLNVFLAVLFMGVPVRPKKNALGSPVRICIPRFPYWVRCASSTITTMLSLSFRLGVISLNLKIVVMRIFRISLDNAVERSFMESTLYVFGISDTANVPDICESNSTLSTTTITVGFFSSGSIRSFCAAKTISNDLPEPWKCQMRPFFGLPTRTLSTMALAPSTC